MAKRETRGVFGKLEFEGKRTFIVKKRKRSSGV